MQLNDVHGYVDLHTDWFWEQGRTVYRPAGGYARLATLIEARRRQYPDATVLLDGGDTFHGTYPVIQTKGELLVPILNQLGFDAMTVHWDFAYGPKRLIELADALTYPVLATNVFHKDSNEPVFPAYRVLDRGGVRIGVIGIACNIVDTMMPPHFSEGIRFTLGRDELAPVIETLRHDEQVDLVVLLSHLGLPQTHKLLTEVPGVDVCLCAHTHDRITQPLHPNGTILIESGCHGVFLGELLLTLENGRIVDYQHQLTEVAESVEPNPAMQLQIDRAMTPYRDELARVVGETTLPLDRSTCLESTMDNLLLASIQEATGAEVVFSNGWRYGAPIPAGPITLGHLYNIIPMNPPISTVDLTGREINDMLEMNLERTFSGDAYEQAGGYVKRVAGLTAFVKMENPKGARILGLFVGDQPVEPDRSYRAAFVTVQGVPPKLGTNRQDTDTHAVAAMVAYLKHHSPISLSPTGTFIPV
ncbi:5'-nucleotidase C-terminal domain-containing protein [Fibrella sp. HMF5335]|uniref:5'-nucleotidase C-terminal domain-containing protein n=2 Tax=Fibrella rubiginis TaxID=2817060 RepID=A0A939K3J5_9BACT|nr:5'-nucleotidase C-terminal domain-containing protein [Fibrella rubiginis]